MFFFFFDPVAIEFGVITEAELQKRIQIERKLEQVTGEPSRLQYWNTDLRGADWALEIAVREFDEGLTSEVIRIVDRFDPEDPKPAIYPSRAGEAMDAEMEHFLQLICSGGPRGGKARTSTRHAV